MLRFLILSILATLVFSFVFNYVIKTLRNIFKPFRQMQNQANSRPKPENEVIFRNDDIVVLKGEAKSSSGKDKFQNPDSGL